MQTSAQDTQSSALFALSQSQRNIAELELSLGGTAVNVVAETVQIRGVFDAEKLQQSLNLLFETDELLRTRITRREGMLLQRVVPYEPQVFPVLDFQSTNEQSLAHWEQTVTREPMQLLDAPLCRPIILRLDTHGAVYLKTHHIITDGWSQINLINRLAKTYLALMEQAQPQLERLPSYRSHVEQEQAYLGSAAFERDLAYWQAQMDKQAQAVSPREGGASVQSAVGQRMTFELPQRISEQLYAFCNEQRVAPFAVLYMALGAYFARTGEVTRVSIGTPVHNRKSHEDKMASGMFVNSLPFVCEVEEEWTFFQYTQHVVEAWLELLRHQNLPFAHINALCKSQEQPLYRMALSFQSSKLYQNDHAAVSFSGTWHYSGYQAEQLCVHFTSLEEDRRFAIHYDFLAQLFSRAEIEGFHTRLMGLLSAALCAPHTPLWQLPLVSEEQIEHTIYGFNQTAPAQLSPTIVKLIEARAQRFPGQAAVIHQGERIDYQSLLARSNAIAQALLRQQPSSEALIGIVMEPSSDVIAAMIGVAKAGCAWALLSPQTPKARLQSIAQNSDVALILTDEASEPLVLSLGCQVISLRAVADSAPFVDHSHKQKLVYVVFTSGSTGVPKGVEIEHASLTNFCVAMKPYYGHDAVLSMCNIGFDAFIIESVAALCNGKTVVMATKHELENPATLAQLIARYAIDFITMTPSRLTAYLKDDEFAMSMRRMRSILCGGEAFPADLLSTLRLLTRANIYNQYGPSEATVGVSIAQLISHVDITIGQPMQGCKAYVLDKYLQPLPVGVFGELCLGGVCLARGYRNDPAQTSERFLNNPFCYGERLYRTGDIACLSQNGQLCVRGRMDNQVKLHGLRIELAEIEQCLRTHPDIAQAVALVHQGEGSQTLVAYYCAPRPLNTGELLRHCATYLPTYMVPSLFVQVNAFVLTPNGKIDFSALPPLEQQPVAPVAADEHCQAVLDVIRCVLKRDDIAANSDYFAVGGDSLNALQTLSALEQRFGVRLRVADLWACRTAQTLSELLPGHVQGTIQTPIEKAPPFAPIPLTPTQQSLYVQHALDQSGVAYNMPGEMRIVGELDVQRLEQAFQAVIAAQPLLRTAFVFEHDQVVMSEQPDVPFVLERLEGCSRAQAHRAFVRPFELSAPPLMRAALFSGQDGCSLLFDMHHIIGDAFGSQAMMALVAEAYERGTSPTPAVHYLDVAYAAAKGPQALNEQAQHHWRAVLSERHRWPSLPAMTRELPLGAQPGETHTLALTSEQSSAVQAHCKKQGITPFTLFTSAMGLVINRVAGSPAVLIGTPLVNRQGAEQDMLGAFIKTLPLRVEYDPAQEADAYLQAMQAQVMTLLDHQGDTLEAIMALDGKDEQTSRGQGLYQAMISLRPTAIESIQLGDCTLLPTPLVLPAAKLPLSLEVYQAGDCYHLELSTMSALYEAGTAKAWLNSLRRAALALCDSGTKALQTLDLLDGLERWRLIEQPRHAHAPTSDLALDERFALAAQHLAMQPAVICGEESTSFEALLAMARNTAGLLQAQGVAGNQSIGIMMKRGAPLLAAMLGVMMAGCAYVPLLNTLPPARLSDMIALGDVRLVLCADERDAALIKRVGSVPCSWQNAPYDFTPPERTLEQNIHVLFTSGSTGQPKGVMLPHRALTNLLDALTPQMERAPGGVLCTTNFPFDTFITETILPLCLGKCVIMADEEQMLLPQLMAQLIHKYQPGLMQFTPSRFWMCLNNEAFCAACR